MAFLSAEKKMVVVAYCCDFDFGFRICNCWLLSSVSAICVHVVLGKSIHINEVEKFATM